MLNTIGVKSVDELYEDVQKQLEPGKNGST